jgi:hypothetical protein
MHIQNILFKNKKKELNKPKMYLVELENQIVNLEIVYLIEKTRLTNQNLVYALHYRNGGYVPLSAEDTKVVQVHIEKMRKTMF